MQFVKNYLKNYRLFQIAFKSNTKKLETVYHLDQKLFNKIK